MNILEKLKNQIPEIEKSLGYTFSDKELLLMAFTHRSFVNENRDLTTKHNERLEFLGDSVLGLLVSDFLYNALPTSREGNLSHLRASIVDSSSCVSYIQKLGIASLSLMGKGEQQNEGRGRDSILADLFEAVIGAIYLDGGLDKARDFFLRHFESAFKEMVSKPQKNWKALLQDYSQKKFQKPPAYEVISEEGPDHMKTFTVCVKVNEQVIGEGQGASKKQAQQKAAESGAQKLGIEE